VVPLTKDAEKDKDEDHSADLIEEQPWAVVAVTPGGTYGMLKAKWPRDVFGHGLCDLLVLDEASQMSLALYAEQWERLLDFAEQVRQFMKEHDAELKRKGT
jgi:hypothetical protein